MVGGIGTMHADRVLAAGKRSIKDRLDGDFDDSYSQGRRNNSGKRQRQNDDRWKHDLYDDGDSKVGSKDLRLKLQRKASQQASQSSRLPQTSVGDLREKLSGIIHSQPSNTDQPNVKLVPDAAKTVKKTISSNELGGMDGKKIVNPSMTEKRVQQKSSLSVSGLLQSLGLEKYSITFQVEEVDMAALKHMTDEDLKALGIPMGPRKKILLALNSKVRNS
ncbi:ankyrin repeat and SAM domain-containing protein 6 isoform X2 [Amborella trichopoda]|uniref:ankyrin repeat and SAM domain-containing protein 6 isoform X2 n=1 Tax=Amborella trichopoda TaxID=13333 RepID=UPI0005D33569|nr:ankyrin repeat and SAM domain-containing protein 6 isoform X2 [Amborella trichopoda]|eukprot:XP_011625554.1 ankyrin repeat and SAM domain-containing protein 6 isoform X2 [Amborella trichopoda]